MSHPFLRVQISDFFHLNPDGYCIELPAGSASVVGCRFELGILGCTKSQRVSFCQDNINHSIYSSPCICEI